MMGIISENEKGIEFQKGTKNIESTHVLPREIIEGMILFLRGAKVILNKDLAELYAVKPIALRQQVRRKLNRFPEDFMFQLTEGEIEMLLSQNVIPSKKILGGHLPYAFTEHGVAMLSSVLRSERAVMVNIHIMRTFTKLREMLTDYIELREKVEDLESAYDHQFTIVFDAIRNMLDNPKQKETVSVFIKPIK